MPVWSIGSRGLLLRLEQPLDLYKLQLVRIAELLAASPDKSWYGVFNLTENYTRSRYP